MWAKFLGSGRLFSFIKKSKFGGFKNFFPTIMSLSDLSFKCRYMLLVLTQEVISKCNDSSLNRWKLWRWVKVDLIFMMIDISVNCNMEPLSKLSSSRSTTFYRYPPMEHLSAMKRVIPIWVWMKVNGNWDNMIRISQWRKCHKRLNTRVRRKK